MQPNNIAKPIDQLTTRVIDRPTVCQREPKAVIDWVGLAELFNKVLILCEPSKTATAITCGHT